MQVNRTIALESLFPGLGYRKAQKKLGRCSGVLFQYLKRLETEPELQESFTLDLFRLLGEEDGFDWPVDDLGRCLAPAVFREQAKQRMDGWVVANRVTRTHSGP